MIDSGAVTFCARSATNRPVSWATYRLHELPMGAFVTRDGELLEANTVCPELVDALLDPEVRWWAVDGALPHPYPWRAGTPWHGSLEGHRADRTWHAEVHVAARADATTLTLCRPASDAEVTRRVLGRAVDTMTEMVTLTTATLDRPGPEVVFVNRAFERITGHARTDVIGATPRILQGPETDRNEIARLRRCLESGQSFQGGTINYRRDGTAFYNEWSIHAIQDASGATANYVSVMRDATDARLHTDQLRVAATEWVKVIDVLDELVVFVNLDRTILRCNEAFRQLTGRTFQELVGQPLAEVLFGAEQSDATEELLRGHNKLGRLPGRDRWFRFVAHPVHRGPLLEGTVHVIEDVTERERMMRISEATSAMENMSQWLSGLRHELGNPINSVKMALTVLATSLPTLLVEDIERYVARALSELGRVEYLLQTLRAVSAIDHPKLTRVEVASFLERLAGVVAPDLRGRDIELSISATDDLVIHADPHALMQVLVNLTANAADAIGARQGHISVLARRRGPRIELAVGDDGCGMSAAQLARLFTPFQTTKTTGTGLGLVIVRKLITAMRGSVTVDSQVDVGTTVTLHLEVSDEQSAAHPAGR